MRDRLPLLPSIVGDPDAGGMLDRSFPADDALLEIEELNAPEVAQARGSLHRPGPAGVAGTDDAALCGLSFRGDDAPGDPADFVGDELHRMPVTGDRSRDILPGLPAIGRS